MPDKSEVFTRLSNLPSAGNLEGELLLVHGKPARDAAEKMARALVNEKKHFDVLPIPGAWHAFTGADEEYLARKNWPLFSGALQALARG